MNDDHKDGKKKKKIVINLVSFWAGVGGGFFFPLFLKWFFPLPLSLEDLLEYMCLRVVILVIIL